MPSYQDSIQKKHTVKLQAARNEDISPNRKKSMSFFNLPQCYLAKSVFFLNPHLLSDTEKADCKQSNNFRGDKKCIKFMI